MRNEIKKTVGGRSVYIYTEGTQTINICSENNERGKYERIYRLSGRSVFDERELERIIDGLSDLVALEKWLENLVENGKAAIEKPSHSFNSDYDPDNDKWLERIKPIVEETINGVLDEFIKFPYLHRVEHSFHTQLVERLRQSSEINERVNIGDEKTQLIHKEWPENNDQDSRSRRGNFDIAILSPNQFNSKPKPNIDDFSKGLIPAPIVIECGLNYSVKHLKDDLDKIINNKPKYGYLIHLVRDAADEQEKIEKEGVFERAEKNGYKIVYACVNGKNVKYKHLDESNITSESR
jgi:hypothetical protein